jgi:type I restriction enzyme S subunit
MELMEKQGYKQTELGWIPEDWILQTIESLTPIGVKFGIVDGPFGSNLKTEHYKKKGIPIITSGYVTNCYFKAEDYLYVDEIKFKQEKRSAVKGGDIVMAKIGARCGASAILPINHEIGILSGNALKISIDKNKYSTELVWQYLLKIYLKGDLEGITSTGAQPAISMSNLKLFKIPLPQTLSEQKAIATALIDVDELTTNLEKLITKKKAIKQGAMQQLLTPPHKGGKRLEGFTGEWEEKKLGDYSYCIRGVSYSGDKDLFSHDNNNSIRLLRSNNVYEKKILFEDLQYVNKEKVSDHQIMKENDILICMANGSKALVGKAGQFKEGDNKYTFGAFMGVLRPVTVKCDPDFIFQQLSTYDFRCHLDILLSGSSINNLRPSDIESFTFYSPDIIEQKAIAKILSDMDLEIEKLQNKKTKYQSLKQGMMQELLTGKTRLI